MRVYYISAGEHEFSAVVKKEGNAYVSLCLDLDIASQGNSVEDALANLKEAVELYLKCENN